jgi:RNA polymerase sigma-70 factor, ECF subfamily
MTTLVFSEYSIKEVALRDRREAYSMMVTSFRDRLVAHAYTYLRRLEQALDVVQETFMRSLKEARLFDEGFKMKAWLYRVVTNTSLNTIRDRKNQLRLRSTNLPKAFHSAPGQVQKVASCKFKSRIAQYVSMLSEDHQKILFLRYWGDLTYLEIADALEIKLGTVMSRLNRARKSLRTILMESNVDLSPISGLSEWANVQPTTYNHD